MKAVLSTQVRITVLHFSQIMFDVKDVESSKKYYIVTEFYDVPVEGMFIPIPEEFVDNFILGLTDFSTVRGKSALHYNWYFQTVDGVFGVQVNESIPYIWRNDYCTVTRAGTMVFYMKTWQCPEGYDFFNLTNNMCQDMCGDYYYENS